MKTQIELARDGIITPQIKRVADDEGFDAEIIRSRVASGEIVIPNNPKRILQSVVGIGTGLRTKVNASIGTSSDICDVDAEVRKAIAAEEEGADTLMELSAGGDLDKVRREVLAASHLPVGNVPLYQAFSEAARKYNRIVQARTQTRSSYGIKEAIGSGAALLGKQGFKLQNAYFRFAA